MRNTPVGSVTLGERIKRAADNEVLLHPARSKEDAIRAMRNAHTYALRHGRQVTTCIARVVTAGPVAGFAVLIAVRVPRSLQ